MALAKKDLEVLKKIRKLLTMETASFEKNIGEQVKILSGFGGATAKMTTTDFIRERTKRWRESWIFPELDELIQKHQ